MEITNKSTGVFYKLQATKNQRKEKKKIWKNIIILIK